MNQALSDLADYISETKGDLVEGTAIAYDELTVHVTPSRLLELLTFLRDDAQCQFVAYVDGCGVTSLVLQLAAVVVVVALELLVVVALVAVVVTVVVLRGRWRWWWRRR